MAELEGMRVLVVGASSGIGRTTARVLHEAGATVVGAARRTERIEELGIPAVHCDLLDPDECMRGAERAVELLGGLDALVSVAGLTHLTPLDEAGYGTWHTLLDTNLVGPALITRAVLAHLLAPTSAHRALYVSSDSARKPYPGMVLYGASKAALEMFSEGLHHEYPVIRSTHVMVGPTLDTEMMRDEDGDRLTPYLQRWIDEGFIRYAPQESPAVAEVILGLLRSDDPPHRADAVGPAI